MRDGSYWIEPDGTEHFNEEVHEHCELLRSVDLVEGVEHGSAFDAGLLRISVCGSDFMAQWKGTLTCAQRTACKTLSIGCKVVCLDPANAGWDPRGAMGAVLETDGSNFERRFNQELRKDRPEDWRD